MDLMEINGLRLRTEVGFSKHEEGKQQEIVVTIQFKIPRKAGRSDRVEDTIDNKTLTKDIISHVENKKYNLIETVAEDIARICVQRYGTPWVNVKVYKPNALRFSDYSAVIVERSPEDYEEWKNVHLSIGSNISPQENIFKVILLLKEAFPEVKISKAFRTKTNGYMEQDDFINIAVLVKTKHDPASLRRILDAMETKLGRVRGVDNENARRTINIDITFWGENKIQFKMAPKDTPYVLPDPDILSLPHVIVPLADLTPDFMHPVEKKSLKSIATDLSGKNFTSFFPIVNIHDANHNHLLRNGDDFSEHMSESINKPLENGKIFRKCERRVALITGGAKRLGACITTKFHDLGYNVMIHYNTSKADAISLCQKLNSVRAGSASFVQGNLTSNIKKTAERIIDECLRIWGRLDVLINTASQFYRTAIAKVTEEIWDDLIHTNLSAPFFLSQASFESLKTSSGCIVNLVDIHTDRPLSDHSVYCISKAGLQMCTLSLAKEFAPYVRVNAVSPGAILMPDIHDSSSSDEMKNDHVSKIPMKEIGEPSDVLFTLEYLVSNAKYVTGQIIRV